MLHTLTFYLIIHIQMYMYIIQMLTNIIIVHHNIIFFFFLVTPMSLEGPMARDGTCAVAMVQAAAVAMPDP